MFFHKENPFQSPTYDVYIPAFERFADLLSEFKLVPNSQIATLIDYDGTLTPYKVTSWDVPDQLDHSCKQIADWRRQIFRQRKIDEETFWRDSLANLENMGFARRLKQVDPSTLPVREGIVDILKATSRFGINIVYSAGLGDVIYPHIRYLQEQHQIPNLHTVANMIGEPDPICSSTKDGRMLLERMENANAVLAATTHYILIGNSRTDTKMADGIDFINVLKIGYTTQKKLQDLDYRKEFGEAFDIVITNPEDFGYATRILGLIV